MVALSELSEQQRDLAQRRFEVLRPHIEDGVALARQQRPRSRRARRDIGCDRGSTNARVELGRYSTTADGERVVYGQRVLGVVRLVDVAADDHGRRYLIERELIAMAEVEAIVADYLQQAAIWDVIPAAGPCCLLADTIERAR